MLLLFRNAVIAVVTIALAVLTAGGLQEAFKFAFPGMSAQSIGHTSADSYAGMLAWFASSFVFGLIAFRFLRSSTPLLWLVLPLLALYGYAVVRTPYAYICNPEYIDTCVLMHATFVFPIAAFLLSYLFRRSRFARGTGAAVQQPHAASTEIDKVPKVNRRRRGADPPR